MSEHFIADAVPTMTIAILSRSFVEIDDG